MNGHMAVWLSGNALASINAFALCQTWWCGGLVVGRRTCDLVVAGSRPGRDAAA